MTIYGYMNKKTLSGKVDRPLFFPHKLNIYAICVNTSCSLLFSFIHLAPTPVGNLLESVSLEKSEMSWYYFQ